MSTIKLYSSTNTSAGAWKLIPGKLFKIDNFSDYLAQFTPLIVSKVQYIKHGLELYVKLDLSQTNAQPNATSGYKYMSIQNTNEGVVYYFVDKATWRSANCVEFHLIMDVLNTYQDGSDYVFKANTRIIREHKDRFTFTKKIEVSIDYSMTTSSGVIDESDRVQLINDHGDVVFIGKVIFIDSSYCNIEIENPTHEEDYEALIEPYLGYTFEIEKVSSPLDYFTFEPATMQDFNFHTTHNYYRKVDYLPENINPLLIKKSNGVKLLDTGLRNQNWYLLYRNANDPDPNELVNPVECYLIPEENTPTDAGVITGGRLVPSWLEENKTYLFDISVLFYGSVVLSNGVSVEFSGSWEHRLIITKAGSKINVLCARVWQPGVPTNWVIDWQYDDIDFIDFSSVPVPYNVYNGHPTIDFNFLYIHSFDEEFTNTLDNADIYGINFLDRADAKNIKCIKLPYCPYHFSYSNGQLEVGNDSNWERAYFEQANNQDMYALHLVNSTTKLENSISASTGNPFTALKVSIVSPRENDLRDTDEVDSKLFNSEFYQPSFVYDSFSIKVELERCNLDYYIENGVSTNNIKFNMTSTINSKFMFTLISYVADKQAQNFYNVLPIARNNEVVLYNVPYINYIRSGYNYDVKNKNIQTGSSWLGVGLSGISIGASLLAPSVPLKVAGVVGSLVSMAMSLKGAITTTMQGEENLKAKLLQAENQTASVMGSDDVDLMSEYCGNRLQYMLYEPTDVMKHMLDELFFYAGYNSGRMGIPNHNTRCNFDYLECDAVLESAGANIPQDIIDEIKNCYKVGVSFIHKTSRSTDKWDIEQKYENWENTILEG